MVFMKDFLKHLIFEKISSQYKHTLPNWLRGYKAFFMLNSTEHEILTAHNN